MNQNSKIKILITGSKGQLGLSFQKLAPVYPDLKFTFTDIDELDICDLNQLNAFIDNNNFDVIINCAAYTAVDKAETDEEMATLLNATAPSYLAQIANQKNIKLVHISTDFVFDGKKTTPYLESDEANPISVYGQTKRDGEKQLIEKTKNAVIFRTSWLYSEFGNNFVKTIQRLARERNSLKVVSDQIGSPTFATDLADALLNSIEKIMAITGIEIFHYSNEGEASWFNFAKEIVDKSNISCSVLPISSSEFPQQATRPAYSIMSKEKIKSQLQIEIPQWQESLKECINLLKA